MAAMQRENLIISADDFGISPEANRNILKLVRAGKINRVSIMANEKISPEEVRELRNSKVMLDIHLELAEINSSERKLKEGVFKRSANFFFNYLSGKISASIIEISWEKQIQKFKEAFAKFPDGLNSHQHIHFFPAYFKIILKLSQKFGIPYFRFGNYGLYKTNNSVYCILNQLHKKDSQMAVTLNSSDFLVSLDWIKDIESFLDNLPQGKTEIICHPEREEEFEIIMKHF
jgi:chitin disaccharide deacetylase